MCLTKLTKDSLLGFSDQQEVLMYPQWHENAPVGGSYDMPIVFSHNGIDQPQYNFDTLMIRMISVCDPTQIRDTVQVVLDFEPACSDLTLEQPYENWTATLDQVVNGNMESDQLLNMQVDIASPHMRNWLNQDATNAQQDNFQNGIGPVEVQYRTESGYEWSTLSNMSLFDTDSTFMLDAQGQLAESTALEWPVIRANSLCNLAPSGECLGYEGEVYLRAKSVCENEFAGSKISNVVNGYVDFIRPELYGSVLPADGFYQQGDELTLRWSEAMDISDPYFSLHTDSIQLRATQNVDYTRNTGGVQFSGDEHIAIVEGPHLDAHYTDDGMIGYPGWSMSWKLWGGGLYALEDTISEALSNPMDSRSALEELLPSNPGKRIILVAPHQYADLGLTFNAHGTVFTQGDMDQTGVMGSLVGLDLFRLTAKAADGTNSQETVSLTNSNTQWNGLWNTIELVFIPNPALYGHDWKVYLNGTLTGVGFLPELGIEGTRITLGNGWASGQASGDALQLPLQDFRLWNSQRETYASETPEFIITGQEIGLQAWLPFNELSGTPVDRARGRDIIMDARWYSPDGGHAMDFSDNLNGNAVVEFSGSNWTPDGTRNTTMEFWFRPGDNEECILSVNGDANPAVDLNMVAWQAFIDDQGRLGMANGPDTLRSPEAISDAWHHVALTRRYNGTVQLFLDGEEIAADPSYDHGKLIPCVVHLGARSSLAGGVSPCTDLGNIQFLTDDIFGNEESLGWGIVNGVVSEVYGDTTVVNLIDYAAALQVDSVTCADACTNLSATDTPPNGFTDFFTGQLDEFRVWNTALDQQTIQKQMREGVYNYENLVLHMPFEERLLDDGNTVVGHDDCYFYAPYDGFDYFNDASSMLTSNGFSPIELNNISFGASVADKVQDENAPLMQSEPQLSTSQIGDVASVSWNSQHDECIIELNEERLYKYEDQLVTFILPRTQVRDERGNATAGDIVFEMLIDRNPLKWSEEVATISSEFDGDAIVYETSILNIGNTSKYFEIDGLPSWMEVYPSSGQIQANGQVTVTFTTPEDLAIGMYEIDARLKGGLPCGNSSSGGFCYAERFTMNIDVFATPPDLDLDEAAFEHIMPLTTKAYVNNVACMDDRDIVMAFIDGELRGYAHLDLHVAGQHLAFLSVHYDEGEEEKEIDFHIWDASHGMTRAEVGTHWPTLEDDTLVKPNLNGIGNLFEPLLLRSTNRMAVTAALYPGWNWVSVNVVDTPATFSVMQAFDDVPHMEILQVKNHEQAFKTASDDLNTGWEINGGMASDVNTRYMVQMSNEDPDKMWFMTNEGFAPHPHDEEFQQDLVYGWNEIGYLPHQAFSVTKSLRHVADADSILSFNDLVQSRSDGFAMYAGDGQWIGSLNTMRPGQGYRLRLGAASNSASGVGEPAGTLVWPTSLGMEYLSLRGAQGDLQWPMNVEDFEATMLGVYRLELPEERPQSLADFLGVFVEGPEGPICIGQGLPMDTDQGLLYFITAFGSPASDLFQGEVTFRWYSGFSELEFVADEILEFETDKVHGDLNDPFLLHFRESGITPEDAGPQALVAFPNPFRDELTIHWHGEEEIVTIQVENASGQVVEVLNCNGLGEGPCRWVTQHLASGVYTVHAITKSGHHTVRVVK